MRDEINENSKITMECFAGLVGVSYRTIKRYIDAGKLIPRRSLGGKPYFLYGDVKVYQQHTSDEPLILDGAPIYDNK